MVGGGGYASATVDVHCTLRTPQSTSVFTEICCPPKNKRYTKKNDVSLILFDTLIELIEEVRDGIFKLLRTPVFESKESIPPAYM